MQLLYFLARCFIKKLRVHLYFIMSKLHKKHWSLQIYIYIYCKATYCKIWIWGNDRYTCLINPWSDWLQTHDRNCLIPAHKSRNNVLWHKTLQFTCHNLLRNLETAVKYPGSKQYLFVKFWSLLYHSLSFQILPECNLYYFIVFCIALCAFKLLIVW